MGIRSYPDLLEKTLTKKLSEAKAKLNWPLKNYIAAWSVHAFTMTGLLWALLAVVALFNKDYKMMWLWLVLAMVVDAADGPMARKAKVSEVVPWFSGVMMDNVVDYLTWTFIPAVFMVMALPLGPMPLPIVAAAMVTMSSMFCYANNLMKSSDWYFVGFPAAWNVVAIILWVFHINVYLNWLVIVLFSILAVVPWKWVHPFRVKQYRQFNAVAAVVWVVTTALLVYFSPVVPLWVAVPWWISGIWILGVSALRSWRGRPDWHK